MRVLTLSILLLASTANSIAHGYTIGKAIGYGSEIKTIGYHILPYYNIHHKTCFSPELLCFSKTSPIVDGKNTNVSLTEFNFSEHHHFDIGIKDTGIYPLTGLNSSREQEGRNIHEAFGLNLGTRMYYSKNNWAIFTKLVPLTGSLSEQTLLFRFLYTPPKTTHDRNNFFTH